MTHISPAEMKAFLRGFAVHTYTQPTLLTNCGTSYIKLHCGIKVRQQLWNIPEIWKANSQKQSGNIFARHYALAAAASFVNTVTYSNTHIITTLPTSHNLTREIILTENSWILPPGESQNRYKYSHDCFHKIQMHICREKLTAEGVKNKMSKSQNLLIRDKEAVLLCFGLLLQLLWAFTCC